MDTETFIPVTTDGLKYGKRVLVVGLKCYPMSLVPYEQDFECVQLPNENFWDDTYPGWDRWTELQAFAALFEGRCV